MFQVVEIRAKGFPFHLPHADFVNKYSVIWTERDGVDKGTGGDMEGDTDQDKAGRILIHVGAKMRLGEESRFMGKAQVLYKGSWCVVH